MDDKTMILFLDIDGVLNYDTMEPIIAEGTNHGFHGVHMIDPKKVELLNALTSQTNCDVVISSTWRQKFTIEEMSNMLRVRGFVGKVIDMTPRPFKVNEREWSQKSDEIAAWLQAHPSIDKFVILDDDEFLALQNFHVRTNSQYGLTKGDVEKAVAIL